jgi:hypothetical protein
MKKEQRYISFVYFFEEQAETQNVPGMIAKQSLLKELEKNLENIEAFNSPH